MCVLRKEIKVIPRGRSWRIDYALINDKTGEPMACRLYVYPDELHSTLTRIRNNPNIRFEHAQRIHPYEVHLLFRSRIRDRLHRLFQRK